MPKCKHELLAVFAENVFLRNNIPQSYRIYFIEDKLSVYNIRTVYLTG